MTIHLVHRARRMGSAALVCVSLIACGRDGGEAEQRPDSAAAVHADNAGGVVQLDSAQMVAADLVVQPVETTSVMGLSLTATITYDANRVSHVGSRTEGRILSLRADIGERVNAGAVLAILESPDVGNTRSEEHEAQALLGIARENFEREQRLERAGISSRKELLDAEAELRRREAALRSAQERLRVLGAEHGTGSEFAITSPFAGVVVDRQASRGEQAGPETRLFTIADLSRVWIELDVFERDLARVRPGQRVVVTTAAYAGRAFLGRIAYVGAVLDSVRRTVRARVEIPNGDGALRPGMFAAARVQTSDASRLAPMVVVPQDAVQEVDGRPVVFVAGDRAGEFRVVAVELGPPADSARVVVLAGLRPGSRIVVRGAFLLRSELARGELAEEEH